jgi:WD40 repeat protein
VRRRLLLAFALAGCASATPEPPDVPAAAVRLGSPRFLQRDPIASLAFSTDGTRVAAGDVAGRVVLWDVAAGETVGRLEGLDDVASAVAVSSDGTRVAAMTLAMHAVVWDANGRECSRIVMPDMGPMHCGIAWTRDGARLALGGVKTLVADARDGSTVATWDHTVIWSVAFSPDGALLAEGGYRVRVVDPSTGKTVSELADPAPRSSFNSLAGAVFVTDGARVVEAVIGNGVALRRDGDAPVTRLEIASGDVGVCAISPDGSRFAVCTNDGVVSVWDWAEGHAIAHIRPPGVGVHAIAFSPDARLVATGGGEGRVRIWDAATGGEIAPAAGHAGPVLAVAVSPDGCRVATAGRDGTVRLWDARTAAEERVLMRAIGPVHAVAFSADGRLVAAGGWDRKVTVVDAATGEIRSVSAELTDDVRAIAFSAGGTATSVAAAPSKCPPGHTDRVTATATCDGGRTIVSASWDGTVRRWDAATGRETGRVEDADVEFTALALSPGGRTVWAGRSDGTVVGYPLDSLTGSR